MNQNQHQDTTQATPADEPAQPIAAEVQDLAPELDVTGGQNNLKQLGLATVTLSGNNLKQMSLAGA